MTKNAETFFSEGCGRCALGGTPECKVHRWQHDKVIRFTNPEQIRKMEDWMKIYIFEAIEVEKAGLKVQKSQTPDLPDELKHTFETVPALKEAFGALPPGKQRGWVLYFSEPKQAQTRQARIIKSIPKMLNGKGLHDK